MLVTESGDELTSVDDLTYIAIQDIKVSGQYNNEVVIKFDIIEEEAASEIDDYGGYKNYIYTNLWGYYNGSFNLSTNGDYLRLQRSDEEEVPESEDEE